MAGNGLGLWDIQLGDTIRDEAIADFLARPRLEEAMRNSVGKALEFCDTDPLAHANFRDVGRLILATIALYLDATGGLTHRRLREIATEAGTLSAGRATAILLHLRMIGYVTAKATRADGSARLYVPTEKMKAVFRRRIRIEVESLAMLEPEIAPLLATFDEDETFQILISHFGALIGRVPEHRHEIALKRYDAITTKNSGTIMLFGLFQAADKGSDFPPAGLAPVNVSAMARRFGVSRAHVLRVLREAEEAGFLSRMPGGDGVVLTPYLAEAFRLYYAIAHIIIGAVAYRTLATLKEAQSKAAQ